MDFYDIPNDKRDAQQTSNAPAADDKPWLGVFFECCKVYARAHKTATGTHYVGHCPRCASPVRFKIGEGGSGARFWSAG